MHYHTYVELAYTITPFLEIHSRQRFEKQWEAASEMKRKAQLQNKDAILHMAVYPTVISFTLRSGIRYCIKVVECYVEP